MLKRLIFTALAAALVVNVGHALDNPTSKVVIPIHRTNPTDGKQMFTSYCAPCHGVDGRGHGPAAAALKSNVTDLTGLAKAHNGKFPDTHVAAILRFGDEGTGHRSVMPAWGTIFANMNSLSSMEQDQRASNVVRYIESLQSK